MRDWKIRLAYFVSAVAVAVLGFASRHYGSSLPAFLAEYAGDTLWALMLFLGISVLVPATGSFRRGAIAVAIAYAVELSQLYRAPWIDAVRQTRLGGLVLGFGFLWTDIVCYSIAVSLGVIVDCLVLRAMPVPRQ